MTAYKIAGSIVAILSLPVFLFGCGTPLANSNVTNSGSNDTAASSNSTVQTQTADLAVKAPPFKLPTFSGSTLSLNQLLAKKEPIVVNYFASWCPPCNAEMPDFTAVSNQYSDKVQFLGVDAIGEDSTSGIKNFIKKYNIKFPVILDKNNDIAIKYALSGHPETFIISQNGTIVWADPGPVTKGILVQTINQVLKQK